MHNETIIDIRKDGKEYHTKSGKVIKTDLAFLCTGIKSNYEFMKKKFNDSLTDKNQIIVNEYIGSIGNSCWNLSWTCQPSSGL